MSTKIQLDFKYALGAGKELLDLLSGKPSTAAVSLAEELHKSYNTLVNGNGAGNSFLGWVNLPSLITEAELNSICKRAEEIREKSEVFVCIGIGGSYLGAKAVIEALKPALSKGMKNGPEILYAGHHLSEDYMTELLEYLDNRSYSICIISKSGTTTEPAIAFRLLRKHIEKKYGKQEARTRIIAITDKSKGALRKLSDKEGYTTYIVPDEVGGRYSVLTPVGLFPLAVAGVDIKSLVRGAAEQQAQSLSAGDNIKENLSLQYAFYRQYLYRGGKSIEMMVNYDPRLSYFSEWWKQLYGESEGKERKGLFPASVSFTTDLHSMGQYIQDGPSVILETLISVKEQNTKLLVPREEDDSDGMNFVAEQRLSYVNSKAEEGTNIAHSVQGNVPVLRIEIPAIKEDIIGALIYFFEMSCGISGYSMNVNPFDQPGVEAYKKNMFKLLGKE